jgi:AAA+ ATPase superfamily predicted ATPase
VRAGFVNREHELAALERWWNRPRAGLALVWGRRRVGKTWLIDALAGGRRSLVHVAAGRSPSRELALLSSAAAALPMSGMRDLRARPFLDWDDALESLAAAAESEPLLVVLDEFPELVAHSPELPGVVRSLLDRVGSATKLRLVLCGSAVRVMQALEDERAPLYGRVDLSLQVHPFAPQEAALMLPRLVPADQALVWGLLGGVPLYLSWWDQDSSVAENLSRLVCAPGGRLLGEGQLVLATETHGPTLTGPVLRAIGSGATKHNQIADAVRADPSRTLDRLVELRLVERLVPVTDDPRATRRRLYRIADNFLAFWLGVVDRYRSEIERGLGDAILPVLLEDLDDALGPPWEEATRIHLRRLAAAGQLGPGVVAVGPFWRDGAGEIDAVVLAGRARRPVLAGEAKWARRVDARRIEVDLVRKAALLGGGDIRLAISGREEVTHARPDTLRITAADIFA